MKKIYALVAGLVLAGSISAQTLVDGGFQSTYLPGSNLGVNSTNVGGYVNVAAQTINWIVVGGNETASPITGSQSAAAVSVDDSVAASTLGFSNNKITGLIEQVYEGDFQVGANSNSMNFTFKYKYAPQGADTAMVQVMVIDTNVTANNGILWVGLALFPNAAATATTASITTWQTVQTGTPNMMVVDFVSSYGAFLDGTPAPVGSKFTVDDVTLTIGGVSVEEIAKASSKVYPNPVSDVLNVELANGEAKSISIYGLDGSLVKTEALNGVKGSVNVADLNAGMYIYKISTNNGEVKATFVKK